MTETPEEQSGRVIYRRIIGYALPHWRVFLLALFGMVLYALTEPSLAAMMKPLVDGSLVEKDLSTIKLVPLIMIGLFIVRGVASFLSTYCTRWVGRKVVAGLRQDLFSHLLQLPATYFDSTSTGELLSKMVYNVEQVAQASANAITVLVRDSITIILLISYMFYVNVFLSLLFLVTGPLLAVAVRYVSKRFRSISKRIQGSMGLVTHVSQEVIEGQRIVKAFGGKDVELARFTKANEKNRHLHMKMVATDAVSVPLIQLMSATTLAGIVYLASMESMQHQISPGTFMSFITAMAMLLSPIKRLTSVNAQLQKGIAAGQSIFNLLDIPLERNSGTQCLEQVQGHIEFRAVSHHYSQRDEEVLQGIDLKIEAGQTVAFVGRSGSGKTTLVSLLPRFYDATSGQIFLDDHDVHTLDLENLRSHVALVSQEVTLFNDSIAHNIAYGRLEKASREAIEQAAEAAHALEFIRAMPQGLDTQVGEHGVLLSGGQRQRIAIARAVLKDAPVLIMDEATSALDSESEQHIRQAMEQLMKKRTTLVIAHRLSTIEQADLIVVMKKGQIVERGSHKELLALQGEYAELHRLQTYAGNA